VTSDRPSLITVYIPIAIALCDLGIHIHDSPRLSELSHQ
jgi:hypothetical protein